MSTPQSRREFLRPRRLLDSAYGSARRRAPGKAEIAEREDQLRLHRRRRQGRQRHRRRRPASATSSPSATSTRTRWTRQGARSIPKAKKSTTSARCSTRWASSIDAVTVSTPDHTTPRPPRWRMQMGKHCYCQKPLTHSVYEARQLGEIAREKKVATQMGNQGTADNGLRRSASR